MGFPLCVILNAIPSQKAKVLKANGYTPETSPELANYLKILEICSREASGSTLRNPFQTSITHTVPELPHAMNHSATNGVVPNGSASPVPAAYSSAPQSPVSFTGDQINALRAQIHAFKLIQRGLPIPDQLQAAIRVPNQAVPELEKLLRGEEVSMNGRVVDNAVKVHKSSNVNDGDQQLQQHEQQQQDADDEVKAEEELHELNAADLPKGPFLEDDVKSGIYPYNAFRHPLTHLKRDATTDPAVFATRLQRLLIPSLTPTGLDPHQIVAERNRYVDARIEQRIRELEGLPATMGEGGLESVVDTDKENANAGLGGGEEEEAKDLRALMHPPPQTHGKLRAMLELKALRVLDKQRALRASVAERLTHGSLLPLNRADFRRMRKPNIRDARLTEQAERKQRAERERRAKQKHVEQLGVICAHGRDVLAANRAAQDRVLRLGKAVLALHVHTEKEEQKRIERISKERLKALKADDEEAYMKLIDTAKDTRITHLLRQTDAYLDSLAQAVMEQQREGDFMGGNFEQEEGPTSEETFGAQKADYEEDKGKMDYYAVAHRLKEKVTKQPALLIGGTLKEYQIKGLQWMVSLYNNKLNGILADEMVSHILCTLILAFLAHK